MTGFMVPVISSCLSIVTLVKTDSLLRLSASFSVLRSRGVGGAYFAAGLNGNSVPATLLLAGEGAGG
jgi:hypothetical protein